MDVAALNLSIDSSSVPKASGELERFKRAANDAGTSADRVGQDSRRGGQGVRTLGDEAKKSEGALGGLARQAKMLGAALTAALSVRAIVGAADAWSDMQSRVGAAVKDMAAAPQLMQRMVDIANASYSPLTQTVEVYGRNVAVLRDLGRSATEAADFTESLNHALITTATKGQDADVVLNALSRAISIGGLRAMEYETIMSRSPRVLEAIADQMGTNIVALRQLASEGKITGAVIVDALINNLELLRQEAGEMPATIGDAFVRMQTNFTALIGTLDQTYGISERIAASILWLTDNLSRLVNVVLAAGVAFVSYRVALIAVTAAQGAATVSTTAWAASVALAYRGAGLLGAAQVVLGSTAVGAAAGMRVLATAMLANPALWLAGAITTLVMTLKSVADANAAAEERFKANAMAARDLGLALSEAGAEAIGAARETAGVGRDAATAEPKIWSYKNATDNLTQSLWEQAKAARAARVEMLQQQLAAAQERETAAQRMTVGGARALRGQASQSLMSGDILGGLSQAWEAQKIRWQQVLSGGRVAREAMRDYQDAAKIAIETQRQLDEALSSPIGAADVPQRMAAAAEATDKAEKASRALKEALSEEQKAIDARNEATTGFIASLEEEIARIGLNEQALRALEVAKARDAAVTDQQRQKIDELSAARERALEAEATRQDGIAFDALIEGLQRQRGEIMLTGRALEEHRYITERLNQASRDGIAISDERMERIRREAAEYAGLKTAVEGQAAAWKKISDDAAKTVADFLQRQKDQVNAARDAVGGFFDDWFYSVREGGNLFKSFGDSVVNSLNRIIDKLQNRAIDSFLDKLFPTGSSGGLLGRLFGGSAAPNALGGVYGAPQRFAQGAAFTNTVVSTPTLFRFANGAKLGEMGEAGPEAIMPLKRGPNGALGVQVHGGGGKPAIRMGDYNPTFSFAGAVGLDGIAAMVRQGGEATYNQMKRDLEALLAQLDRDGTFAS